MTKYTDCNIGRRMEIDVAQMKGDIEHIKESNDIQNKSLEKILEKIDGFDDRYASKDSFKWVVRAGTMALLSIIGFLIKLLLM